MSPRFSISLLVGLVLPALAVADDLVIRRDGSRQSGTLRSCAGDRCSFSSGALARASIAWIGFDVAADAAAPAPPARTESDALVLRDGKVVAETVLGVSLGAVATEASEFERSAVAWICFDCASLGAVPAPPGGASSSRPVPPVIPPRQAGAAGASPPPVPASGMPGVPDDPPPSPRMPPRPSGPATILLNEVLFLPAAGAPQFVELRNTTAAKVRLEGYALVNQKEETKALPPTLTIGPGQVAVIELQGFLAATGWIALRKGTAELDRVAWGAGEPGAVRLSRGGAGDEVGPGWTIGRLPRSTAWGRREWTLYEPRQATPGTANPHPAVSILLPPDGASVPPPSVALHWYPVPGAARYRVEVAADPGFAAPVVAREAARPPLDVTLAAGTYHWRVQAINGQGDAAPFSPSASLNVTDRVRAERIAALARGYALAAAQAPAEAPSILDVPMIKQHKDTRMLQIEDPSETGPHSWDGDHGDLDTSDPADNMNCVSASIAMMTAFYGGKLSQDRINFEVHHDDVSGPAWDLNWGVGFETFDDITQGLTFALGAEPTRETPSDELFDEALLAARMEAGMPILVRLQAPHAVVVSGYVGREVIVNDPWVGKYVAPVALITRAMVWWSLADEPAGVGHRAAHPRSDEPEVATDSDGDGLVDFDESRRRFATHPHLSDSDQDGVDDKTDIRASVMDEHYGYALGGPGRDFDGDGKAMELDSDSDDGGCFDGMEDRNKNGRHDRFGLSMGEQYNFEKSDDACWTSTFELVLEDKEIYEDGDVIHQRHRTYGQGGLTKNELGQLKGEAHLTAALWGVAQNPDCPGDYRYDFEWSVDLEGEVQALPDGMLLVAAKATPERGPDFLFRWNTACPGDPSRFDGVSFPGWSLTIYRLQDEAEQRLDVPSFDPSIVEFWSRYTLRRVGQP